MADYTPSLDEVREEFVEHSAECALEGYGLANLDPPTRAQVRDAFDRMIAQVRAEALSDLEPGDLADILQGISEGLEGMSNRADLRRAADVLRLIAPDEDQGPAAGCHLCVGAGGYEDYDGEWVECSCQRADREPTIADNFLAVAQSLGLSPDLRREGMDRLQAAEDRMADREVRNGA